MTKAIEILNLILTQFPQADPDHELYDSGIDASEAVDFICELMPEIIGCLNAPPPIVAVVLEGGLVQSIASDRPDDVAPATFIVVNYDVSESNEEERLYEVVQGDGTTATAYARFEDVSKSWVDLGTLHHDLSTEERS